MSLPLGKDSVTYRLSLEPFNVVAGGPRALLLQVMHPAVGAGVAQHSDYERDPWTRLFRTLTTMTQLALGTPEASQRMSRLLRQSHARINGVRDDGRPYRALDPENMRWVWATLLDTVMVVADNFVAPLPRRELERLYDEWLLIGEACAVPATACPATVDDFRDYVSETMEHELVATITARNVARTLARPPLPPPLRQAAALIVRTTLPGQLPARLRRQLHLPWSPLDRAAFGLVTTTSRTACRATPASVRHLPGRVALSGTLRAPAPRLRQQPQH